MKKFKKYVNNTFPEEMALVEVTNDNYIIVKGDYYHNKINGLIQGFCLGLDYMNIEYEMEETEYIDPSNELFDVFDFYNDMD